MRKYLVLLSSLMAICLLVSVCVPASVLGTTTFLSTTAPDLIIETINWLPENPVIGNMVTFAVDIRNQGSDQADASKVACYIDDTLLGKDSASQIDPDASVTITFTWKAQAGSHIIKAVADSAQAVTESDESNNEKTFAFSVLAPELIIDTITWSPENPSIREKVTFNVTIKNNGDITARCSFIDLQIDGNSRGYEFVPSIDAGGTVTKTYIWTAQQGLHTIRAIADVLNHVSESDEANNEKIALYSTAFPDLVIDKISWSPTNPVVGDNVTITVSIKNQGSGDSYSSYVAFYIDKSYQATVYVSPLNSGATATMNFVWTAQQGSHTFEAVADSSQNISESDETNNTKTIFIGNLVPDLIVQDITWSPESPLAAHYVTFTVTVINQGSGDASQFRLYFCVDGYCRSYQTVEELTANATATMEFFWTALKGSHTITAIADNDNCVTESNESNNEKTVTISPPSPPPPDLAVQDIVWSPENPCAGDNVTFTVTIKNQSSYRASASDIAYYIDNAYLTSTYLSPLDSDATATLAFVWEAQAGSHTIQAVVDPDQVVSESSEDNNAKTVMFSVSAPDLVVQDITWSPVSSSSGEMVTFTVRIKNQGDTPAGQCDIDYFVDDSSRGYHYVGELAAGDMVTRTFTWTALAIPRTFKAVVDMKNQIAESNEDNNEKTVVFPCADLTIEALTWSPEYPAIDDTVSFSVTIRNQFPGKAAASHVSLFIDDASIGNLEVPEINAGVTVTRTFTWKAQAGSHTIRVVADGDGRVTESDESNNEKEVSLSLSEPPETAPVTVPPSNPAPVPTDAQEELEAKVPPQKQSDEIPIVRDKILKTAESPSSEGLLITFSFVAKQIWPGWWFIVVGVVVSCMAAIIVTRLRARHEKE